MRCCWKMSLCCCFVPNASFCAQVAQRAHSICSLELDSRRFWPPLNKIRIFYIVAALTFQRQFWLFSKLWFAPSVRIYPPVKKKSVVIEVFWLIRSCFNKWSVKYNPVNPIFFLEIGVNGKLFLTRHYLRAKRIPLPSSPPRQRGFSEVNPTSPRLSLSLLSTADVYRAFP